VNSYFAFYRKPEMLIKLLLLCSIFGRSDSIKTGNDTIDDGEHKGEYKYYYDSTRSCGTVYFLGVGTAMTISDYDTVATMIVSGFDIVTIVIDHNPDDLVKTSDTKYAWFYNTIVKSLQDIVPACKQTEEVCSETNGPRYIVGGHSASGQAAINAITEMNPSPDGFIGLDPFKVDRKMSIPNSIPTLMWGFEYTTCFVTIFHAAKEAYHISDETHRIFYRIDNPTIENTNKHSFEHCVFTDNGCMAVGSVAVCPRGNEDNEYVYDAVYNAVAFSIHTFVDAMGSGVFIKSEFELPPQIYSGHYDLFVNEDDV